MDAAAERPHAGDRHIGKLVLLGLDDEGEAGVVLQDVMIEFADHPPARPVPELEHAGDQAAIDELVDQAELGDHLQGRRMGRRGARAGDHVVESFEHLDLETGAGQRQCRQDADRSGARDEDGFVVWHFLSVMPRRVRGIHTVVQDGSPASSGR